MCQPTVGGGSILLLIKKMAFVKTVFFVGRDGTDLHWNTQCVYVPLSSAIAVRCTAKDMWYSTRGDNDPMEWTAFECVTYDEKNATAVEQLHIVLNRTNQWCTRGHCDFVESDGAHPCALFDHLFPLYTIRVGRDDADGWFVVHPDEHERMERILNGTDSPIHDLVHELRYNPALALGAEVAQARKNFNHNKRTK